MGVIKDQINDANEKVELIELILAASNVAPPPSTAWEDNTLKAEIAENLAIQMEIKMSHGRDRENFYLKKKEVQSQDELLKSCQALEKFTMGDKAIEEELLKIEIMGDRYIDFKIFKILWPLEMISISIAELQWTEAAGGVSPRIKSGDLIYITTGSVSNDILQKL